MIKGEKKGLIVKTSCNVILIILTLIFIMRPFSVKADIIINSKAAKPGELVTFAVMIGPESNGIESFGFELRFNNEVLEYEDFSPASFANQFVFDMSKTSDGQIRAGGFIKNPEKPVKVERMTDLVYINFRCLDCVEKETLIEISRKLDDMKNWKSQPGIFACLGAEEEEESTDQQAGGEEMPEETSNKKKKVIELSNKGQSSGPQAAQLNTSYNVFIQPSTVSKSDDQGSAGGGGAWGSDQESFDASGLTSLQGNIPSVQDTIPKDGETEVDLGHPIRIVFNQSMDHLVVENAFIIDPHIDGQFDWENSLVEMIFIPYSQLSPGELYHVHLSDQAADIYGRHLDGDMDGEMGGDYCFSFRTVGNKEIEEDTQEASLSPHIGRCFIMSAMYDKICFP